MRRNILKIGIFLLVVGTVMMAFITIYQIPLNQTIIQQKTVNGINFYILDFNSYLHNIQGNLEQITWQNILGNIPESADRIADGSGNITELIDQVKDFINVIIYVAKINLYVLNAIIMLPIKITIIEPLLLASTLLGINTMTGDFGNAINNVWTFNLQDIMNNINYLA